MAYSLGPVVANLSDPDGVKPEHNIKDVTLGDDNRVYAYGRASGAVSVGTCTYDPATGLITDAAGRHSITFALADGEYGWVRDDTNLTPLATVV